MGAPRLDGSKGAAVLGAGAVPPDRLHMLGHAVALVPCKQGGEQLVQRVGNVPSRWHA